MTLAIIKAGKPNIIIAEGASLVSTLTEQARLNAADAQTSAADAAASALLASDAATAIAPSLVRLSTLIDEIRPDYVAAEVLYRTGTDTQVSNGFRFSSAVDVGSGYDQLPVGEIIDFVDVGLDVIPATAVSAEIKIYQIATADANINAAPPQAGAILVAEQVTDNLVFAGTERFRFVLENPVITEAGTTLFAIWRFLNGAGVEVSAAGRRHNLFPAETRQRYAGYVATSAAGPLTNAPLVARWLFGAGRGAETFVNAPNAARELARGNAARLPLSKLLTPDFAGRISLCGNSIHSQDALVDSSAELSARWFPNAIFRDISAGGANNVAITAQINSLTALELAGTVIVGNGSADYNAAADNTAAIIAVFDHAWSVVNGAGGQLIVIVDYSTGAYSTRHKAAELFVIEALKSKPYANRVFTFGEIFAFSHSQTKADLDNLRVGTRPLSFGTDTEPGLATHLGEDMARALATAVYIPAIAAVNSGAPMAKNMLVGYEAGQAVDSVIATLTALGNAGSTGTLQIVSGNDDDLVRLNEDTFVLTRGAGAAVEYRELRIRAANNFGEHEATVCLGLKHSGTVPNYAVRLSPNRRSIMTRPDLALVNGPKLSIFCGFRHQDPESAVIGEFFNQGGNSRLRQRDGYLDLLLANATNATALPTLTAQIPLDFSKWNLFSFSVDTTTGVTQVRTNYGPVTTGAIATGVNIRLAEICRLFTHANNGNDSVNGDLQFLWIGYDAPNLADDAVIGKFRDAAGAPVSLGANGETPFGTAPPICIYGRPLDYQSGGAQRGAIGKFPALDTVGQSMMQFGPV